MNTIKYFPPEIRPIVKKLARDAVKFNNYADQEDYIQEAFLGYLEAIEKYRMYREDVKTKMRPDVHAVWYIKKKIYNQADNGEIEYWVFDTSGSHIETLKNGEYRKKKKKLETKGYKVRSVRIVESIFQQNENGEEYELPIAQVAQEKN